MSAGRHRTNRTKKKLYSLKCDARTEKIHFPLANRISNFWSWEQWISEDHRAVFNNDHKSIWALLLFYPTESRRRRLDACDTAFFLRNHQNRQRFRQTKKKPTNQKKTSNHYFNFPSVKDKFSEFNFFVVQLREQEPIQICPKPSPSSQTMMI